MQAKCPYCDSGCKCCNDGFFETPFADGPIFVRSCVTEDCGFAQGAQILGPDFPPLSKECRPCSFCGADTVWELYGWNAPDPTDGSDHKPV